MTQVLFYTIVLYRRSRTSAELRAYIARHLLIVRLGAAASTTTACGGGGGSRGCGGCGGCKTARAPLHARGELRRGFLFLLVRVVVRAQAACAAPVVVLIVHREQTLRHVAVGLHPLRLQPRPPAVLLLVIVLVLVLLLVLLLIGRGGGGSRGARLLLLLALALLLLYSAARRASRRSSRRASRCASRCASHRPTLGL